MRSKVCILIVLFVSFFFVTCHAVHASSAYLPVNTSIGELIYVPVYPAIYYMGRKKSLELTVTLSIHNTSPDSEIMLISVDYFSRKGTIIRKMVDMPLKLRALETTSFVVNEKKEGGGVGANFMVSWQAHEAVSRPVVQAVMIMTSGSQGISFLTEGTAVKSLDVASH